MKQEDSQDMGAQTAGSDRPSHCWRDLGIVVGLIYVQKVGGRLSENGPGFHLMLGRLLFCNLMVLNTLEPCSVGLGLIV